MAKSTYNKRSAVCGQDQEEGNKRNKNEPGQCSDQIQWWEPKNKEALVAQVSRKEKSGQGTIVKRTLHVNTAHQLLGHIGKHSTRAISKHLGWTVVQSLFKPFAACARAKTKRKAVVADRYHEVGNQITG